MTFGEKLVYLRGKHAMTQDDLVVSLNSFCKLNKVKLNFTRNQIGQWEVNNNLPNMDKCIVISDFFHVSLDALFRPEIMPDKSKISFKNFVLN